VTLRRQTPSKPDRRLRIPVADSKEPLARTAGGSATSGPILCGLPLYSRSRRVYGTRRWRKRLAPTPARDANQRDNDGNDDGKDHEVYEDVPRLDLHGPGIYARPASHV
jgi:hypothetical protein